MGAGADIGMVCERARVVGLGSTEGLALPTETRSSQRRVTHRATSWPMRSVTGASIIGMALLALQLATLTLPTAPDVSTAGATRPATNMNIRPVTETGGIQENAGTVVDWQTPGRCILSHTYGQPCRVRAR